MDQYKVLILSSNFGGGHLKAGDAILEHLVDGSNKDVLVRHIDFGSFFYKTDFLIRLVYMNIVKKTPEIYRLLFNRTADYTAECYRKLVKGFSPGSFLQFVHSYQPDIIVCTHFLPAGVIAEFKLTGLLNIPIISVVTDYKVHGLWIHTGIDYFLAGSDDVRRRLIKSGINSSKVMVTGIPVRSSFLKNASKHEARIKLMLKPQRQTILVMGGASGLGGKTTAIKDYLMRIERDTKVQFIVICGSDIQLFNQLSEAKEIYNMDYLVYGYVDNVHEMMAASDILVTKGGALTLSEGLTMKLPVIMYKPIPGHEDGNAAFVQQAGAGLIANNVQELETFTLELLSNAELRDKMSYNAGSILPKNSARRASRCIYHIAQHHRKHRLRSEAIG